MGRACTVCQHPARAAIDQALAAGAAPFALARQYSSLSEPALRRHKQEHLPATLAKAHEAGEVARADDLLADVRALQGQTLAILAGAEDAKDYGLALRAIGEARKNLELLAKLLGDLDERPMVNLLVSPEWVTLRGRIVTAIRPHPAAFAALAEVLDADAG
jgi:hypothetical protein